MRTETIVGAAAVALIEKQIAAHSGGIKKVLAPLEAKQAFQSWFETFRAIEEFINLPLFGIDDDELEQRIVELRLDNIVPEELTIVAAGLKEKFGSGFVKRFMTLVAQMHAIGTAFRMHGLFEPAAGLETVKSAIGYFQSRRRHLITMLYSLPEACGGSKLIGEMDTLNVLLTQIEYSGLTLSGLHQKLMLGKVYSDFELTIEDGGFFANHSFETLDAYFLEPERAGILEMHENVSNEVINERYEPVDPRLIFSSAEVRNNIILLEETYKEFDLVGSRFGAIAEFVRECLSRCKDDYFIVLSQGEFDEFSVSAELLKSEQTRLVHEGADYTRNLNVIAPFIRVGDRLHSTVTLLNRFLYYWKNSCLDDVRRYQIRSGFIFEETVKKALTEQGFHVTRIKRINRKEFDVVAILNDVIYNVQCKNNLVDLGKIEADPKIFARYNRRLDRTYAAALLKEEKRESLLKEELGLSEIKHFVLSRFPVATTNERVFAYLCIDQFRELVVGL